MLYPYFTIKILSGTENAESYGKASIDHVKDTDEIWSDAEVSIAHGILPRTQRARLDGQPAGFRTILQRGHEIEAIVLTTRLLGDGISKEQKLTIWTGMLDRVRCWPSYLGLGHVVMVQGLE